AKTGSEESLPRGRTAVTPVRTGPSPSFSLPSPEMRVVCPTATPLTSVMALSGPGAPSRGTPRSRALGLGAAVASAAVISNTTRGPTSKRRPQQHMMDSPGSRPVVATHSLHFVSPHTLAACGYGKHHVARQRHPTGGQADRTGQRPVLLWTLPRRLG